MVKLKTAKVNIPNKVLHSRVSYLYQAATYLASAQQPHSDSEPLTSPPETRILRAGNPTNLPESRSKNSSEAAYHPASRRLVSELRSVTLKGQMRISPAMKHSMCKKCDTILVDGSTSTYEVENKSKGGKKSWADVFVRRCQTCGMEKRFPMAQRRQKRRAHRSLPHKAISEDHQNGAEG